MWRSDVGTTVRISGPGAADPRGLRTDQRRRWRAGDPVPVEAYLADYPTRSEIERAIGRPRIPIDIVVGTSIRITGVRD